MNSSRPNCNILILYKITITHHWSKYIYRGLVSLMIETSVRAGECNSVVCRDEGETGRRLSLAHIGHLIGV